MHERVRQAQAAASAGHTDPGTRPLRRFLPYLRPYRAHLAGIAACAIAGAVAGLVPALATRSLVNALTRRGPVLSWHVIVLVVVATAATLLASAIFFGQSYLAALISQGVMRQLRELVFGHLISQPFSFFAEVRTGELMSLITNDVGGVEDAISDVLLTMGTNAVIALTTLALMISMDWRLTLVSVALVPLGVIPSRRLGRANFRSQDAVQQQLSRLTTYLHEFLGLSGVQLIKSFGTELAEQSRFAAICRSLSRAERRRTVASGSFQLVISGLTGAGQWVVWLAGGLLVATGSASLGTVVAFITILLNRMGSSLGSLGNVHVVLSGSRAIAGRILRGIAEPAQMTEGTASLGQVSGNISVERVSYTYPSTGAEALHEVSLDVHPGELVALVGPSGAGKTTLANLICRFMDPTAGTVSIDSVNVRDLTSASLRGAVGMVLQDTFLFHGTIRENLRYPRPDVSDGEVIAAARAAHAHDFITALPDGYDTTVGERGQRLSGGERQRIAIARVLVKDPPVLILDEATSNLDSASERLIQHALEPLLATRTSVVIAHRLATIMAADRIVVLSGGRVADQGTHAELLGRSALYMTLFRAQFAASRRSPALNPGPGGPAPDDNTGGGMDKLPFLSSEWFAEATQIRARHQERRPGPAEAEAIQVNHVITGVPFGNGTVLAHIDTSGAESSFGPGHVDGPDLTITLGYEVARAILVEGNPQAAMKAYMTGQLQVRGEMGKLIAAQQHMQNLYSPAAASRIRQITA
ncbi:MAG: ABC transporter transmembrane domain-containing protein [Streptosporangiaceae bacterium]